jgi:hypothetical protein
MMVNRFYVPKFITIEDKLAGILTFRQLFALLGAFFLSFLVFRLNQFLGFITALVSLGIAVLLTFFYVNGKPFIYVLPRALDFFFRSNRFTWKRIEKVTYKEVRMPKELGIEAATTKIPKRKTLIRSAEIIIEYPEANTKEKFNISLEKPIASQIEEINQLTHRHLLNPQNPYRFFPYIKFYRSSK